MHEAAKLLEFLVDLVCMMPPLKAIREMALPQTLALTAFAAACAFLVFTITKRVISDTPLFAKNALVVAGCVVALGFIGLKEHNILSWILPPYVALILTLRLLEGILLGQALRLKARPWHGPVALLSAIAIYGLLHQTPPQTTSIFKTVWAVVGAAVAAFQWSRQLTQTNAGPLNGVAGPDTAVALFLVFVSTFLYTQASPFLYASYQCIFPAGLLFALLGKFKWRSS
jgi:hypothetical protein